MRIHRRQRRRLHITVTVRTVAPHATAVGATFADQLARRLAATRPGVLESRLLEGPAYRCDWLLDQAADLSETVQQYATGRAASPRCGSPP
jgi:hypothetical protein